MSARTIALTTALLASISSAGDEPHFDILLDVNAENRIVTGGTTAEPGEPGEMIPNIRIFESELGEGPIEHFSDEPGFNALSGTFAPGTLVGFDIMDHLRRWDPAEGDFDEIPVETMLINLGVVSVTTPAASESPTFPVPGFFFAAASGTGSLHQHVNFFLNAPQTSGVYLLQLRVVTDGGELPSETAYILFNENAPLEDVENAEFFLEQLINGADSCPGDCDQNGVVDFNDLVCTLFQFDSDDPISDCDGSGLVDFNDLICALFAFGPCPE